MAQGTIVQCIGAVVDVEFPRDQMPKIYDALKMEGSALTEQGSIDYPLSRQPDEAEWIDPRATLTPQPALTYWRRLATAELPLPNDRYPATRIALLELRPETGRRHQIRRHLKHIAHPIIGDATHGKGPINRAFAAYTGCNRLLLHCAALELPLPDGRPLHLTAPTSGTLAALLASLAWPDGSGCGALPA